MKILKSHRAEGYIDIAVAVLVIAFVLIFIVSIFGVAVKKQDLDYMCSELLEAAVSSGQIGSEVDARYIELCNETGLTPDMTFTADYYNAVEGKVQLGDTISCTLTVEMSLMGFGDYLFPFEMAVKMSGLSRVYWK